MPDLAAYREYLEGHPDEWAVLEGLVHVTISRFNRDRGVFGFLETDVLPALARHDVRDPPPSGPFDLVLCRNLAFTYFDERGQRATATRLAGALRPGGALVLGKHEALPAGVDGLEPWSPGERIYRRGGSTGG